MPPKKVLVIEWMNTKDLAPLREYCKNSILELVNFDDVFTVKYDSKTKFFRFWIHIRRFSLKNIKSYFNYIWSAFITRKYVYYPDNVRKLHIMSLTLEHYKKTMEKHGIRAIIIKREDPWLNNLIIFSKKLGIKVIVLNNEFIYGRSKPSIELAKSFPFRCNLMLASGQCAKDNWSMAINADPKKIKITGATRFDGYHDGTYMSRKEFCKRLGLNPNNKIIFFPSCINTYDEFGYVLDSHMMNDIQKPEDLEFFWKKKTLIPLNFIQFKKDNLSTLLEIARENPSVQVILKLHPDQQKTPAHCTVYEIDAIDRNLGKNFVGIVGIPKNLTARDIIANSDLVIGHNSTMLVEAIIMKKTVIQVCWGEAKKIWCLPLHEFGCSKIAYSKKELRDLVFEWIMTGKKPKNYVEARKKTIKYYFHKLDGNACKRCTEEILRLLK